MKNFNKSQLLLTTLLSGATFGATALPAFAQDNDEIVVTGTRIERVNLESSSPVTAIDAQELTLTNTINTEQFINALPQLIPAFDGTSNNPGTGTATANLRGLGSARTLVLVDGNRYVSAFGNGVVDLNSIPSSLVKRVDIVTGGASAVYGSDAMAGVVNFILDDEFEGIELEASYQASERGDAAIKNISATMGGNFDNGRGNATIFLGYTQRDAVFQGDRDFSTVANQDLGAGVGFGPFGSSGVPGSRIFATFDFTNAGYTTDGTTCTAPAGGSAEGLSGTCTGGATFAGNGDIIPWINSGANTTRYNYAPVNYLQLPQERYTMAAFGTYDVTDNITAKLRGIFTSNNVPTELAPTPFFRTVTIDIDNNPFLTPSTEAAFRAANGGGGLFPIYIGRRMLESGPRNSNQELDSYQLAGGLEGSFSEEWDWELHAHINRVNGVQVQTGNISISAMQAAVLSNTCNIFGQGVFSDACVTQVTRTGTIQNTTEQRNLVFTTDGPVNSLVSPMAENPMQLVLGAEYREEQYDLRPDSVLGPDVSGFNQALPIAGDFNTYELFGEMYFPLIEGAAFAEELSLNGAYRYSDYSTVGGVSSYAIGAEWAPTSDVRFRGQLQRAVRAPNVTELFSPQTNGFPGAQDPCAAASPTAPATATLAQCTSTAPAIPAAIYNTGFQPNSQIPSLFGGNPNLGEETGDTITIGAVIQPSAIDGLTLTVDYYDIEIDDVISTLPVQDLLDNCYNGVAPAFCSLITRSAAGTITNISLTNANLSKLTAKGIDAELSYNFDAEDVGMDFIGGEFAFNIIGGYRIESGFQSTAATAFFDCAGYYGAGGPGCGEPNPEWKHTATLRHTKGALLNSLRWRYIGGTDEDDLLNGVQSGRFVTDIAAKNYFDFTSQYDINDHFQISAGIINIFDTDPPVLGDCCSEQANTWPASYNPFGRQFFISGKARF